MSLWSRLRGKEGRLLGTLVAAITISTSGLLVQPDGADAARDERTLTLYEIHLKETTTVTYKRDGKYLPAGLKKLNHAMRDWRTGVATRMDPKLFDTVWELKQQLGFTKAIHVISGHRSAKTNRKLRRRGGGQAKKSQHVRGRAMDIHFPGVKVSKVREQAFLLEVGGVGYYPTSALPFVHVDTARVRSWPRMGRSQLAMLFPHGATKHRPSSGGPLNSRDRKRARIRIAALNLKKRRSSVLLASASIPAAKMSPATFSSRAAKTPASTAKVVVASLTAPRPSSAKVSGLSRHGSRLWVNNSSDRALPVQVLTASNSSQNTGQSFAKGASYAKSPARQRKPAAPKARIQLASLSPQEFVRPTADPRAKLWVNGAGLRSTWLTETEPEVVQPKTAKRQTKINSRIKTTIAAQTLSNLEKTMNESAPGGTTADQLRSIIERIENLEEEKANMTADIREIYSEAKGNGFDVKALRAIVRMRKKDDHERLEEEAVLATYMHALGMADPEE